MTQFTLYRAYIKQRRPSGSTQSWQDVLPLTISYTDGSGHTTVIEQDSTHCGYVPPVEPQYRWVNIPINQDYECDTTTYTKYYKQKRQVSYDNGATWNDVSPAEYQRGGVYESNSIDCGYVVPTGMKVAYALNNGSVVSIPCDSSSWLLLLPEEKKPTDYSQYEWFLVCYNYPYKDIEVRALDVVSGAIGDCVTTVQYGFTYCSNLSSVTIPNSVEELYMAFEWCSGLTSVELPSGLTTIGWDTFRKCSGLNDITIPASVTVIQDGAFYSCTSLSGITMLSEVPPTLVEERTGPGALTSVTGVFTDTNECPIHVPSASTNAYKAAWPQYAHRINPDPYIKATLYYTDGTSYEVPFNNNRNLYGREILNSSTVASAVVTRAVDVIGTYTFYRCTALTSVTFSNTITTIGGAAFQGCSGITNIVIPDSVTGIGYQAFANAGLTSVTIPGSVTTIGNDAFSFCHNLLNATIGNGVTDIGSGTFKQCESLTSITIPNSVTSIGGNAFYWTGLVSVVIPNSVTTIGERAFYQSDLTSVTIGNGVNDIGISAFYGCTDLTGITILAATPPHLQQDQPSLKPTAFDNTNDCPIYVPAASVDTYKYSWSKYASRIFPIGS